MNKAPFRAVLFDMDGVIIDTQSAVDAFWLNLANAHNIALSSSDFTRHIYGCSANHTLDALFPMLSRTEREELHATMADYEVNQTYQAVPGALALLRVLKDHVIPTALVTSGADFKVRAVSAQLQLEGLFTTEVTSNAIHHSKPHPEGYLTAAARLGIPAQQCIVIEDALSGIEAGRAAGALCIGVSGPEGAEQLRQAGASSILPDLAGLQVKTIDGQLTLQVNGTTSLPLAVTV